MLRPRDLPLLAIFVTVARRGSFTAAARELGLAKSVVSDHVRSLEERCAVRLFERTSRRLRLTQAGEQIVPLAAAVADAPAGVEAVLAEQRDAVVGTLRVTTTHDLGARFVIPAAARLGAQHPGLSVHVVTDDDVRDLIEGRFDLAVRLGAPRDSGYVMRKLGVVRDVIVGAPALADAWPVERPGGLAGAPWARHVLLPRADVWSFRGPRGESEQIVVSVRGETNTAEGLRALTLGGIGFAVMPEYLVADDLRRGALRRVCPAWHWADLSLYAILPSARRAPRRASLFLAALRDTVRGSVGIRPTLEAG
ncbi:MAG TPA: LysR family transcriptional regulator [Polyangiaceae bacterium]|nr:LysR family transcriptional regulator [Polyangiaceae bacterium]